LLFELPVTSDHAVQPDALDGALMYASLWRFRGDPDDLLRAFDAITPELPLANFRFHASLRAPDGMIVVDTCPSKRSSTTSSADERSASLPVLALTAQAMEGDRERFLAAGFDGYLSKPVDIAQFVTTVERYSEVSRASGS
jgi:DNA-binding NarL/FixJ family response regulator